MIFPSITNVFTGIVFSLVPNIMGSIELQTNRDQLIKAGLEKAHKINQNQNVWVYTNGILIATIKGYC